MDLWQSMAGMVQIELTSADVAAALRQISNHAIPIFTVQPGYDMLSVRFQVRRKDSAKLKTLAEKKGDSVKILRHLGLYWKCKSLLKRPVLIAGLILFLMLTFYLPTRVLFFQVEGNENIPARKILACCQELGIGFGASRRDVRSEKLKNALLEAMPELQWAGINTSGCVATVSVRERSSPPQMEESNGVSSIVAAQDAVITECTVTRGTAACKPGDSVTAGQVLISGFTDCGLTIRAQQAQGEVYGKTQRLLRVLTPAKQEKRQDTGSSVKKFSLILGKKRINFYNGSGISPDSCVKMVSSEELTLPGGFRLPVTLVCERWTSTELTPSSVQEEEVLNYLPDFGRSYLSRQMIAGTVRSESCKVSFQEDCYLLEGSYDCTEMIGISKKEENILPNGEHD